jgi:hypothetical protein
MTDYDRDYYNWKHDQSKARDFEPEPDRNDYDESRYKKGSVVYEGDLILDPYLIETYGIEYARQNPLNR